MNIRTSDRNLFIDKVRNSKIKHPTQLGFSKEKWEIAYNSIQNPTDIDNKLYRAGLWIYSYLEDIRYNLSLFHNKIKYNVELRQLIVAVVNRDYFISLTSMYEHLESQSKNTLLTGVLSEMKIPAGPNGIDVNPTRITDLSVSASRHPLSETFKTVYLNNSNSSKSESLQVLPEILNLASAYDLICDLWGEILWNRWSLNETSRFDFVSPEQSTSNLNRAISEHRVSNLGHEFVVLTKQLWENLPDDLKTDYIENMLITAIHKSNKKDRLF